MTKLLEYFNGDELAASVWKSKYALPEEQTPEDMHRRMATELAKIEKNYKDEHFIKETELYHLSEMGKRFVKKDITLNTETIFNYFDKFKYIIPQGSIMSALGNNYKIQSLSNCFVIPSPLDSYGGIFKTDQQIAQLEKRRGGVGTNLDTLRPDNTAVSNAAGTSTGAHSFMDRFSNTTREVAQNGRRGALMLLMSVNHPDIFKFVEKKKDKTKVTGANVSVMLTDDFMKATEAEEDFLCTFPTDIPIVFKIEDFKTYEYNTLHKMKASGNYEFYVMRIKAKELFDEIVYNAWDNAEPGIAFIDRIKEYCPEGVYPKFVPIASNPCGEQWLPAYDACRLLATNVFSFVINPFTPYSNLDLDKVYEVFYMQQRLADDIVDLEIEYIEKIIQKIITDPEPEDVKAIELSLWENIKRVAKSSRRTGCGFTGLADMLAALNVKYDSPVALGIVQKFMYTKMKAELDCTIDLAITRGHFEEWDLSKEANIDFCISSPTLIGKNEWYNMLINEYPDQFHRMIRFGRRNINFSTLAPAGSISILGIAGNFFNMSSGGEPQFSVYHWRKRKVLKEEQHDEVDATGDCWKYYPVVMGAFKEWLHSKGWDNIEDRLSKLTKDEMEVVYKQSPWFESTANDISWEKRIEMQATIQKYTTNAISSTLNLPKDVSKETVANIYKAAWKKGLKGVTVYRDGCRDGVLVYDKKTAAFEHVDSIKRPKEIDGILHVVSVKGAKYGVLVGSINDKPYELFAFNLPSEVKTKCSGKIIKVKKGHYNFIYESGIMRNIEDAAVRHDEQVLTRLVSGLLRHRVAPHFIMEQIDKCELEIVSFGKAISRILKTYVKDNELIERTKCSNCNSSNIKMQEGCMTCIDCGHSKC